MTDGDMLFVTPAPWGWKTLSPSAAIGRNDPAARRIGSGSRTLTHRWDQMVDPDAEHA